MGLIVYYPKKMKIEEFCEREDNFSAKDKKKSLDKEAAEEIGKKAMQRMASKKKNQMNPLEAAPKKFEEAGAMQLKFWKKKLKVSFPFANRS